MDDPKVPELMSKARAAALAGISRPTLDSWIADGVITLVGKFNQVSTAQLARRLGRDIDIRAWGIATAKLAEEAMARNSAAVRATEAA